MADKTITTTQRAGASADSLLDVKRTFKDRLAYAGRFLWRDRSGVIGMILFLTVVIAAVFAPQI